MKNKTIVSNTAINTDLEMLLALIKLKSIAIIKRKILLVSHFLLALFLILLFPEILDHQSMIICSLLINAGLFLDCIIKGIKCERLKGKIKALRQC